MSSILELIVSLLRTLLGYPKISAEDRNQSLFFAIENTLRALQQEDEAVLTKQLWWPLTWFVSSKKVLEGWRLLAFTPGRLQSFDKPILHRDGLLPVTKTLVHFQRGDWGVTTTFGPGHKVLGVHVHPTVTIGLSPPWSPPNYVDEGAFSSETVLVKAGLFWPGVRGIIDFPKKKGRKPADLLVPGSGNNDIDLFVGYIKYFRDLAHGLASRGFVVLRLDKPIAKIAVKTFITKSLTLDDEYLPHNLAGLQLLGKHPEVDPSRLFVIGASLGGRLAPRICGRSSVPVAGMISLAGSARPLIETMIYQHKYLQKHFPGPIGEYEKHLAGLEELDSTIKSKHVTRNTTNPMNKLPLSVPLSYWLDDLNHDAISAAAALSLPMLYMQGGRDWQVTTTDGFKWQRGLQTASEQDPGRVAFKLYDNLTHMFTACPQGLEGSKQYDLPVHVAEEVLDDMVFWMQKRDL